MKEGDYINILAPMRSTLKLKGNAMLLFALIHGYSKDSVNRCRVSLKYMAEWLDTDKSAVSKLISKLHSAGYINKIECFRGGVKYYEYTSNYDALLERASRGEPMGLERPSIAGGCQIDNGCQNDHKGLSKRQRGVVKTTTNNNNIIIYNNFSCASPAEQEEEKKAFYTDFFFRNAADPSVEVEKFIGYNDSMGWKNDKGRAYDTREKRMGLAKLWEFKQEGQWARADYLKAVDGIYSSANAHGISGVEVMINHKVNLSWDGIAGKWIWSVTPEARRWVEAHAPLVHQHLDPVTKGKTVMWQMIN